MSQTVAHHLYGPQILCGELVAEGKRKKFLRAQRTANVVRKMRRMEMFFNGLIRSIKLHCGPYICVAVLYVGLTVSEFL